MFRRIARALGLEHPRYYDSDLELARRPPDTEQARERGIAPFSEGGFPTPSGKVELSSERLAARGQDPLVGFVAPHEILDRELAERFPLVLMAPAGRFFLNSTFASLPWHRDRMGGIAVHLHPDDAAERDLADGDPIRIFNDRGAFLYKSHWPKHLEGGVNANATTPERDADMRGAPTFHDNRVQIEGLRRLRRTSEAPGARVAAAV